MAFLGEKFEYNGHSSEEFNLLICSFDNKSEYDSNTYLSMDPIYSNTISTAYQKDYGAVYKEVLIPSCSVIHSDGSEFNDDQIEQILSWLTGNRELKWLSIKKYDGNVVNILCRVTRVTERKIGDITVGFTIDWTANSPYSFSNIYKVSSEILGETSSIIINNNGDELFDYVYPKITYTEYPNSSSNLSLQIVNETDDNRTLKIFNLGNNEKVYIDNLNQIINIVGNNNRILGNDFNNKWVRLLPGKNKLNITCNGKIEIEYRLPLKVGGF